MKRIIKVLVVSALMMVLMATTVSPAFAAKKKDDHPSWWGGPDTCETSCGYGTDGADGWAYGRNR